MIRLEHLEAIACTCKMAYDVGVQDVRLRSLSIVDGNHGPALDQWGSGWGRQRTLLLMQKRAAEHPWQSPEVWRQFGRLFLPKWDLDFMRRVLWKKLPMGGCMGHRVGSKLCSLCNRLDDHEHVLWHCRFSAFMPERLLVWFSGKGAHWNPTEFSLMNWPYPCK